MLLDGASLRGGDRLEAEVAVVGAGPAGIVVALELADAGHRVLLIESGGRAPDEQTQRLGDLDGEDPLHVPMSLTTSRQIGGASNIWGGRCVPFDPIDFQERELVGAESRWPVAYAEVEPYFQRACDWCVCGEAVFDAHRVPELAGRALVPGFPEGPVLASALERWSLPTNFGRVYRVRLADSRMLRLVTNLTCTEVVCDGDGDGARNGDGARDGEGARVAHLRARTPAGSEVTIRAHRYVLACGGLETTRLLFASNRHHLQGIGNHSGHLGRWYMAHVESRIAQVHFTTPPGETIYGHERDRDGVYVRRRLTFPREVLEREQLPNTAMWLVNPAISAPSHGSGVLSFAYLMLASPLGRRFVAEGIRQAHIKSSGEVSVRAHLRNVGRDLGPAARFALSFGYRRYLKRGRKVPGFFVGSAANTYPLLYHAEHLPHRESYVEPSESRDALGMPRLRTHLRFDGVDVASVLGAHRLLDGHLRSSGLGHVEYLYGDCEAAVREQLFGGYHQAGTTRMSARPEDGVVDGELAVHGFDDLHVASSSTFVTSGQANSTFMIVAFALRLADRLRSQLAAPAVRSVQAPQRS